MSDKDPLSPATTSDAYDHMVPSWIKIQSVLDGTRAMRTAGSLYLPQHDQETDPAYRERLDKATLMNVSKLTLDTWVGRPFSEPLELKEDVPAQIVDLVENIDTLGNHINVFSRNVFHEALAKGFTHILVDMPRLETEEGQVRTMADDLNVQPYWVHINPEQLFFAEAATINGEEVLLEIRFWEEFTEREGFAEVAKEQVKRIYLDSKGQVLVEVWREVKSNRKKKEWKVIESYGMDIDKIPLVTFYADRTGLMVGVPPIEDLVDLNVAHWQSNSDQTAILTTTRFPILAVSGGTDETHKLVVGPNRFIYVPDPQGRVYYVEHTGAAIGAGRESLNDLLRQMGEYGAEFLKKRPNRETATARALDSSESTSYLQDVTLRFMDTLENALDLTAQWMGLEDGGSVELNTDFGPNPLGGEALRVLIEARKNRDISRPAFVAELVRAKILDEDYDEEDDELLLENEMLSIQMMTPDPSPMPELNSGNSE